MRLVKKKRKKLTKEEIEKEIEKVERIARMVSKKIPKGKTSVEIRDQRD